MVRLKTGVKYVCNFIYFVLKTVRYDKFVGSN